MSLLKLDISKEERLSAVGFLSLCQNPTGGFGGGPQQQSHLAPTYASVCALCTVGLPEALSTVDRKMMYRFLVSLRSREGAFMMHEGGEVDVRGCYCAVVAAKVLHIGTPELFKGTADWIGSCQTYEGGLSGYPGLEAHGGYTYCGVAALVLLQRTDAIDLERLSHWLVQRQMSVEGGFQGRTNKLVDGCYSFWIGCLFQLIDPILPRSADSSHFFYNRDALQEYILFLAQSPGGGFRDKPGVPPDYYHTCYVLSGLSACQHGGRGARNTSIVGPFSNLLSPIEPKINICLHAFRKAEEYFSALDGLHSRIVEEQ
ncbi:protein farnesyltransferase subunit beta-like [Zophobas morio]|uniref:protein farnesyltransferase subunit beta-like n=1 Tax=Zophobas morio TaxID=2755281 RepID=UPI003083DB95